MVRDMDGCFSGTRGPRYSTRQERQVRKEWSGKWRGGGILSPMSWGERVSNVRLKYYRDPSPCLLLLGSVVRS